MSEFTIPTTPFTPVGVPPEAPMAAPVGDQLAVLKDLLKPEELSALKKQAVERWKEVSENAAVYIKENPGRAVLAGVGIGFAIGLLFRRD